MNNLKKGDLVKVYFIMSDACAGEAIINHIFINNKGLEYAYTIFNLTEQKYQYLGLQCYIVKI